MPRRLDSGVGYELEARFITGERTDTIIVPRSSVIQSPDGSRYVWVVEGDEIRRRPVTTGLANDLQIEILSGLATENRIVTTPDATMREGDEIDAQEGP